MYRHPYVLLRVYYLQVGCANCSEPHLRAAEVYHHQTLTVYFYYIHSPLIRTDILVHVVPVQTGEIILYLSCTLHNCAGLSSKVFHTKTLTFIMFQLSLKRGGVGTRALKFAQAHQVLRSLWAEHEEFPAANWRPQLLIIHTEDQVPQHPLASTITPPNVLFAPIIFFSSEGARIGCNVAMRAVPETRGRHGDDCFCSGPGPDLAIRSLICTPLRGTFKTSKHIMIFTLPKNLHLLLCCWYHSLISTNIRFALAKSGLSSQGEQGATTCSSFDE